MPNTKNLKRWKKGESGNPTGKKIGGYASFTQALRRIGFEIDPDSPDAVSYYESAARTMWKLATHINNQGSMGGIEKIACRLDGKPVETVNVNTTVTQKS